jgi:hypothetical protein
MESIRSKYVTYHGSSTSVYGSQYAHHISTGGTVKCDECRDDLCGTNLDNPCYVCSACNQGLCTSCGPSHCCPTIESAYKQNCCGSHTTQYHDSSNSVYGSQYAHHISTGGTVKCDVCRTDLCGQSSDNPCYVCSRCNKGMCTDCGPSHE